MYLKVLLNIRKWMSLWTNILGNGSMKETWTVSLSAWVGVLVCGAAIQTPELGWLKQQELISLDLGARRLRPRCQPIQILVSLAFPQCVGEARKRERALWCLCV